MKSKALIKSISPIVLMIVLAACQKNQSGDPRVAVVSSSPAEQSKQAPAGKGDSSERENEIPSRQETPAEPDQEKTSVEINISKNTKGLDPRFLTKEFVAELNRYTVAIQISENLIGKVRVLRSVDGEEFQEVENLSSRADSLLLDVISNNNEKLFPQKYVYVVLRGSETLATKSFEVLADLHVSGQAISKDVGLVPGKYRLGLIYLESRSRLNTQGQNFEIVADELIANESVIESFSEDEAKAPQEQGLAGRDGGRIDIRVSKAQGDLTVVMRGTAGGKGHPAGTQPPILERAANGADEVSHREKVCEPAVAKERDPNAVISRPHSCQVIKRCIAQAQSGSQGSTGLAGKKGERGMPGGKSGTFQLQAIASFDFSVTLKAEGGLGGVGGDGGPGGVGGPGGYPGASSICPALATEGPVGKTGLPGERGDKGATGEAEILCIKKSINDAIECR